jgi:virginiamycin B lyase
MNAIVRRTRIYGIAACVAMLAGAGCNGGGSSSGSAVGLPAGLTQHSLKTLAKPPSGTITEYLIPRRRPGGPKTFPVGITLGPDGTMWFTERGPGRLGHIRTNGQFFGNGHRLTGLARHPQIVATGPDGNLWATAGSTRSYSQESRGVPDPYGAVEAMTPSGQVTSVTPLPMYSDPRTITPGPTSAPNKTLWFTARSGFIGRITLRKNAVNLSTFRLPHLHSAFGIAVGPDNNLWFCELNNDTLGRITPTGGVITLFPFPTYGSPAGVVTGPDGNLWVTEFYLNRVAQVTTSGQILKEVELTYGAVPKGIAVGGDGNLYIAEFNTGKIAQVSTAGVLLQEYDIPTPNSGPWSIAADRDGNIWFTESLVGKIGKLTLSAK